MENKKITKKNVAPKKTAAKEKATTKPRTAISTKKTVVSKKPAAPTKPGLSKGPVVSKKESEPKKELGVIEKILSPTNNDNIILFNERNESVEFEQIALIPYKNNLYSILHPVNFTDEVAMDEAVVFLLKDDEKFGVILDVIDDDDLIDAVFDIYNKLYDETQKMNKK